MKNLTEIIDNIGNALRSLYQMILVVNDETLECHVIDYNEELRSISKSITDFGAFCEDLYENIHPEDREAFDNFTNPNHFPNELSEKVYTSMECRIRQVNGQYYWSEIIFCNATEEDSAVGDDYLFLLRDIHEWKTKELLREAEERDIINSLQGQYDALFEENMKDQQTGCYNRKGMKYYSDIVIDEAREEKKYLFVCEADLNGLKYINDHYGHAAGDEAIAAVSARLLQSAPEGSRIVRIGGDEFLIFAAIDKDSSEPREMEVKLAQGLKEFNESHENPYDVGASFGWVLLPPEEDMVDLDKYVALADEKMYEMKEKTDLHRRE